MEAFKNLIGGDRVLHAHEDRVRYLLTKWVQLRHGRACRHRYVPARGDGPRARPALRAFSPSLLGTRGRRGRQGPPCHGATAGPLAGRRRAPFARAAPRRARLAGAAVLRARLLQAAASGPPRRASRFSAGARFAYTLWTFVPHTRRGG